MQSEDRFVNSFFLWGFSTSPLLTQLVHGQLLEHLNLSRLHSAHETVCLVLAPLRFVDGAEAGPAGEDEALGRSLARFATDEEVEGGSILPEFEDEGCCCGGGGGIGVVVLLPGPAGEVRSTGDCEMGKMGVGGGPGAKLGRDMVETR